MKREAEVVLSRRYAEGNCQDGMEGGRTKGQK